MTKITKINHVAIGVSDIDAALAFWRDELGLAVSHVEDVPSQKALVAFLPTGDSEVELVQPSSSDTGLARFLSEKGPGLHHLCFEVENLDEFLVELKGKGIRLINETAQVLPGRKVAFIHPKAANGVLVELYELIPER